MRVLQRLCVSLLFALLLVFSFHSMSARANDSRSTQPTQPQVAAVADEEKDEKEDEGEGDEEGEDDEKGEHEGK